MSTLTHWSLVVAAIAMPVVSWLTQAGAFGGDIGAESNRFPTLLVPAGYAFAIWGPIFLLNVAFAGWQAAPARAEEHSLARARPWAIAGFLLTAAWMPVFSQQAYVAAVIVIWAALVGVLVAALYVARAERGAAAASPLARVPLALHAGWLSLAAFVNTAQLALALGLTTASTQWPLSLGLWIAAAVLLLAAQRALAVAAASLLAYTAAALWGLVAVVLQQHASTLVGAQASALVAAVLIVALCAHAAWLLRATRADMPAAPAYAARR